MRVMGADAGPALTSRRCWAERKQHAVRMVLGLGEELGASVGTVTRVACRLGCGVESVRRWVAQAGIDAGARAGVASAESAELKRFRRGSRELRRASEFVRRAAVLFG